MTLASVLAATAPPPADNTTTLVIIGAAGVAFVYIMSRMSKQRTKREPENSFFTRNSLAQERRAQQDMENVLVELSKMSRELSAQLDTRAAKLDTLIADADERIVRLETLLKQAPARPDFGQHAFTSPAAESLMRIAQSPAPMPTDDVAPSPTIEPSHAEVYRLADEGKTVGQIAGELSRPSGEVELILALRPRN